MRYLITGGGGFIGSNLARSLVADGHSVIALDDFSRGRMERIPDVEIAVGDVRDFDTVADAMHGCDAVVHMAYLQGTQTFYAEPRQVLDVAVRGMSNVLSACEITGVGDLMLISSSEAYQVASIVPTPEDIPLTVPDPLNSRYSYGGGKIACELMAIAWQRTGVLDRATIVRPHNIYGPDMGFEHVIPEFCRKMSRIATLETEAPFPFTIQGTGQETRSFCYISDCVRQLRILLEAAEPLGIYNVGTQDERTIEQVAHAVAACYGRQIKVLPGTLPKGSPPRRLPDMSKLERMGYMPQVPFDAGIVKTCDWYKAWWANG